MYVYLPGSYPFTFLRYRKPGSSKAATNVLAASVRSLFKSSVGMDIVYCHTMHTESKPGQMGVYSLDCACADDRYSVRQHHVIAFLGFAYIFAELDLH